MLRTEGGSKYRLLYSLEPMTMYTVLNDSLDRCADLLVSQLYLKVNSRSTSFGTGNVSDMVLVDRSQKIFYKSLWKMAESLHINVWVKRCIPSVAELPIDEKVNNLLSDHTSGTVFHTVYISTTFPIYQLNDVCLLENANNWQIQRSEQSK